jgi:hypothetical protein
MNEDESINNPRWHEDVEEGDRHEVELNRAQNPDPGRPTRAKCVVELLSSGVSIL